MELESLDRVKDDSAKGSHPRDKDDDKKERPGRVFKKSAESLLEGFSKEKVKELLDRAAGDSAKLSPQKVCHELQRLLSQVTKNPAEEFTTRAELLKDAKKLTRGADDSVEHSRTENGGTIRGGKAKGKIQINFGYQDPPFPDALKETKPLKKDKDILETFQDCEVNVPLFKLIENVPAFLS